MALDFYSRLQQLTIDATHDFTDVAMSFTSAGTTSFAAAAGFAGDGLLCSAGASYLDSGNVTGLISPSAGALGFMIRFPSSVPTFGDRVVIAEVGATESIRINVTTGPSFRLQYFANGQTYSVTSNVTISSNTWYGVVARWDQPNDRLELELYDSVGASLGSWSLGTAFNAWTTAFRYFRVGNVGSATAAGHYDNLFFADAVDEPIQNNLSIDSYTSYSAATTSLYPSMSPLYYGATLLANKTNIEYAVWLATAFSAAPDSHGTNGTTDGSGNFVWPGAGFAGTASDPATVALYWEEGSAPVVDRSLIVKTTLVEV